MPLPIPRPFKGVIPPLVTPLTARDEIEKDGLARVIERMIAAGVSGVFALGHDRRSASPQPCGTPGDDHGNLPIGPQSRAGAGRRDGLLRRGSLGAGPLRSRSRRIRGGLRLSLLLPDERATACCAGRWHSPKQTPLPFFLYNIPSHTRNSFPLEAVRAIAPHPMCLGMKDSAGDWDYFASLIEMARGFPGYTVLLGPEEGLARALDMGAHGGVTGGANLAPTLFVDIWRAMRDNQRATAHALQETSLFLSREIYAEGYLTGLKCALELAGICSGRLTDGLVPIEGEARERIRRALSALPI